MCVLRLRHFVVLFGMQGRRPRHFVAPLRIQGCILVGQLGRDPARFAAPRSSSAQANDRPALGQLGEPWSRVGRTAFGDLRFCQVAQLKEEHCQLIGGARPALSGRVACISDDVLHRQGLERQPSGIRTLEQILHQLSPESQGLQLLFGLGGVPLVHIGADELVEQPSGQGRGDARLYGHYLDAAGFDARQ